MKLDKLYDLAKTGKIKVWSIRTEGNKIITEHGYENGNLTTKTKIIHKGKNIGKSNETTPEQQAASEAKSKWQKKLDSGYVVSKAKVGSNKTYHPMLAKTYYPSWHAKVKSGKRTTSKLPTKIVVQPKLK